MVQDYFSDDGYSPSNEVLEKAYEAMEELEAPASSGWPSVNQPVGTETGAGRTYQKDGIARAVKARLNPRTCEVSIYAQAFMDKVKNGEIDRYSLEEEIAAFEHETEAVEHAVQKAYEKSLEVDEDELEHRRTRDSQDLVIP